MKSLLVLFFLSAVGMTAVGGATGGGPPDLLKSATRFAQLKPGATYQASLFAPNVRITVPDATWLGAQYVNHGYDWFVLPQRPPFRGGILVVSAPRSTQSAATTLHRLESERADIAAVGISIQPAVAVTIAGFPAQQFDGTVTGQYGHTFVPFSGHSTGASSSAGDHFRLAKDKAFRIIVLNVRGRPVVFESDSDTPRIEPAVLASATRLLGLMRFPKA